jgi:GH35 family endo-1,4-beta-xylanase
MRVIAIIAATATTVGLANGQLIHSTYKGAKGLNDLAKAKGKYMGTATNSADVTAYDAPYLKELDNAADWGFLTPANAMKWESTEPTQNEFQFTQGDLLIAQANKIGAKARCHALCWHQQTPQWVHDLEKDELLAALKNHITKVMTHYGDSCSHWDVLNEALEENGTYRNSFWYQKTGTEYIKVAFQTASEVKKQLGLSTQLYYNDYNTDRINAKSTGALNNIVKFLQNQSIEINGMGLQAHLTAGQVASVDDQIANMKRFTDLGLNVAITELDVKVNTKTPSKELQKQQTEDYEKTIKACKKLKGCLGVTVWDFSDEWSWINDFSQDTPSPFYQPGGRNTTVVRKMAYDGIVRGWGV